VPTGTRLPLDGAPAGILRHFRQMSPMKPSLSRRPLRRTLATALLAAAGMVRAETAAEPPPMALSAAPSAAPSASTAAGSSADARGWRAHFHGALNASAELDWAVLDGGRYEVRLNINLGGLLQRRTASQGRIGPQGLVPERYDESNKVLGRDRQASVKLGEQSIELADGRREDRPAGVQDAASQFFQLTHLFTTQPGRLRVGQAVEFPLALARRVTPYAYQAQEPETLETPIGPIEAVHVKPSRADMRDREVVAEMWFAPRLNNLPVRIRISQGDGTYVDLLVARPPVAVN
jgi:hypothetical protein